MSQLSISDFLFIRIFCCFIFFEPYCHHFYPFLMLHIFEWGLFVAESELYGKEYLLNYYVIYQNIVDFFNLRNGLICLKQLFVSTCLFENVFFDITETSNKSWKWWETVSGHTFFLEGRPIIMWTKIRWRSLTKSPKMLTKEMVAYVLLTSTFLVKIFSCIG